MRLLVLTIALMFIGALAGLTVRDIHAHGLTPVAVLAIGMTSEGLRSHSTFPEFTSNSSPDFSGSLSLVEILCAGRASAIP